ncbi:Putative cytochrome P450 [Septoria linicola]|uniref:Cytochrome P450 n=1 Tax=Septoria linicola TaxID=215465 RepID=A0A9Q9ELB8_9PEZI|nr:Putative cytochrome P450 [Septoria linicola]
MALETIFISSTARLLFSCIAVAVLTTVCKLIQRLFLSPLANIPGPKLAAATGWVETYYDVWQGGQFIFKLKEWHRTYGPIIRITPWEVHVLDPEFFDEMYSAKSKHSKIAHLGHRLNIPLATSEQIGHEEHHRRRAAIAPLFTTARVREFTGYLQSSANKLCSTMRQDYADTGRILCLDHAFTAYTADAVTWFSMAMSYNYLGVPDFHSEFAAATKVLASSIHVITHFLWLGDLLASIPPSVMSRLSTHMAALSAFYAEIGRQIRLIMDGSNKGYETVAHRTVFHEILSSKVLRPDEKTPEVLSDEARSIVLAAIDNTKGILCTACFWTLKNPAIKAQLCQELREAIPDASNMPALAVLQNLPYLQAVLQEATRMGGGVSQRLFRTNPTTPLQYGSYTLPPGTIFGMSIPLQQMHPEVFPSPHEFKPERWLDGGLAPNGRPLSRYLVAFGRGPRMCLGMNLANAELYIALATFFRRMDVTLFETERDAVDMAADYFLPRVKADTKGVRVLVNA